MYFGLSEPQKQIRDTFNRALSKHSSLETVRKTVEAKSPYNQNIWQSVSELGMCGLLVPEEYGGAGLGLLETVLVAEELGRHVTPTPFVASNVLAPLALLRAGNESQKQTWLPKLASGESRLGFAIPNAAGGTREDAGISFKSGKLIGRALFVLDGVDADGIILSDDAGQFYLIDSNAAGLEQERLTTIDRTRSIITLRLYNVEAEPLEQRTDILADLMAAGRIALAADSLGASEAMLEQAVAYSLERKQFGRVIGSFQAVKHMCAEMAAELQPCRALLWHTAYTFDQDLGDIPIAGLRAKSHTDDVGRFVARTATEVHGGMGFTDLLGLHYWFKRIGANRALFGTPEYLRQELARIQGYERDE